MPMVTLQTNATNSSIDFNYVLDDDEVCPRIMEDIEIVASVTNQLVVVYGCTDLDEGHEEGAWIFGLKSNITESMKHLNESLNLLKNSSAKFEDFRVFNSSTTANLTGTDVSDKKIRHARDKNEHAFGVSCKLPRL